MLQVRRLVREKGVELIMIDYLQLMNANGVEVKAYEGLQDNIDLSDLPAGIYFLNIENKNTGANEMQKVSIVK